jgi:putative heme-binding domain-containing protein
MGREMGAEMSPKAIKAGLDAASELGGRGRAVTTLFTALSKTGKAPDASTRSMQDWAKLVQERGNALKGERIYHGAAVNCVQCHAIGGAGGKLGPDMSTLGASAPLDYIVESVLEPAAKVKEGYHGVSYTLTDGGAVVGVPFDESSTVVRVRMPGGVETEVPKAKIKSNDIIGSLMPQGLVEGLSEEDKLNLFAFLGCVGRLGAFDASSGGVARAWKIVPGVDAAKNAALLATAPAAFSLTDGRVLPEHFQTPLAMSPGSADVYAVTKLALGSAGRVHLEVEGAADFWINGEKVPGKSADRELAAGDHWVGVLVKRDALPEVLRATATAGRFVAP